MHRIALGLLAASSLLACVDAPDLGESSTGLGPGSGDRENGRSMLGVIADDLAGQTSDEYLTGSLTGVIRNGTAVAVTVAAPSGHGPCLRVNGASCPNSNAVGLVFKGGNGLYDRLRIDAAVTFTGGVSQTMYGYVVKHNASWANGGPPTWVSYCVDDRLAYPIEGRALRDGSLVADTTVTFACSEYTSAGVRPTNAIDLTGNGVLAKVQSWGFLRGGSFTSLSGTAVDGDVLFQTAARATHADYCFDGTTHSIDATEIHVSDLVPGNAATNTTGVIEPSPTDSGALIEPISTDMFLEAAFGNESVVCLSRLRWQTLPLGHRCTSAGEQLPDPRLPPLGGGAPAPACEDYATRLDLATDGATTVVQSTWNDVGLWQWKHAPSGDYYATTVGRYGGVSPAGNVPPARDYEPAPTPAQAMLGTLITTAGWNALSAAYPGAAGTTVMLRSCQNGTEWATATTAAMPSGYSNCKNEGRVFSAVPTQAVLDELGWPTPIELVLYEKNGGTTEYQTATSPPVGYTAIATLGKILPPNNAW